MTFCFEYWNELFIAFAKVQHFVTRAVTEIDDVAKEDYIVD